MSDTMATKYRKLVPPPGGQLSIEAVAGPMIYNAPTSELSTRVVSVPLDEWQVGVAGPMMTPEESLAWRESRGAVDGNRPLIPSTAEAQSIPSSARIAYLDRCAARVSRLAPRGQTPAPRLEPQSAAALIVASATIGMPIRKLLLCIRRDFDRLVYLARKHHWTDDTPVPPEVFGRMWPKTLEPAWAKEPG